MKNFGERLTDENSLGMQAYTTILNLGYWKKLVYILEKKISLNLCMKFFDFKNYMLLMKAFMTQDEKINNKEEGHLSQNQTLNFTANNKTKSINRF